MTAHPDAASDTIAQLRAFLERNLVWDANAARQAGHGFIDILEKRNAGWTDIDTTANVRPSYDARLVRAFSPDRVLAECAAKRETIQDVAGTDAEEVVLRALAYVYADRPGYGDWDSTLERTGRGRRAGVRCVSCGETDEVYDKDREHRTTATWETGHHCSVS